MAAEDRKQTVLLFVAGLCQMIGPLLFKVRFLSIQTPTAIHQTPESYL